MIRMVLVRTDNLTSSRLHPICEVEDRRWLEEVLEHLIEPLTREDMDHPPILPCFWNPLLFCPRLEALTELFGSVGFWFGQKRRHKFTHLNRYFFVVCLFLCLFFMSSPNDHCVNKASVFGLLLGSYREELPRLLFTLSSFSVRFPSARPGAPNITQ